RIFSVFISTMKNVVFEHLKLNRIFTETYSLRTEHIKILESNGFLYEGAHRKKILINGKYYDSLFHSILKADER
ncbi:MAG: GNAT family protein, partial [Bdellovibrionota bacterium]|nr:GNAT family protein [Bdellovibrionota bacterium]